MDDHFDDDAIDSAQNELSHERHAKYYGTAKIPLDALDLDNGLDFNIDKRNVERLINIFEHNHVQRLKPDNYVNALVSRYDLERCLQLSHLSMATLLEDVNLPVIEVAEGVKFRLIHGQHRIRAARQFLDIEQGRWWSVELYDETLSDTNVVKQLIDREPAFRSALDELLPFIGVWASWELGALNRILPLHCSEESEKYLSKTRQVLDLITLGRAELRGLLDPSTMQCLETLSPGLSTADKDLVRTAMDDKRLFPLITDEVVRSQILEQLYTLQEPIYSLRTYLEDIKLVQLGFTSLQFLVPATKKQLRGTSVRSCLRNTHSRCRSNTVIPIQVSKDRFVSRLCPAEKVFKVKFFQLFLHCLREFHSLTRIAPRKYRGNRIVESNESSLWKLANLAHRLGFQSSKIDEIREHSPETQLVVNFLQSQWPHEEYIYPTDERYQFASEICTKMSQYPKRHPSNRESPVLSTDLIAQKPKAERYGRPVDSDYNVNRAFLYFDNIYASHGLSPARSLTSFAMVRFAMIAFFGDLTLPDYGESGPSDGPDFGTSSTADLTPPSNATLPNPPSDGRPVPAVAEGPSSTQTSHSAHVCLPTSSQPREPDVLNSTTMYPKNPDGAFTKLLPSIPLADYVQVHLQSALFEKIVLYLYADRHFTRFSKNAAGQKAFNECVQGLANKDNCFYVVKEGSRAIATHIRYLWSEAQEFSLVIIVKKCTPTPNGYYPRSKCSLGSLLGSLESM
ncbi:hypothetical protein H2204_011719 [Knufia peltigerae]|uniref:Uncharacterized protein n=1 Tax=Knufia peltigerae TaxID=1002370 RepID=A0AA39CSX8_9EURO|nr:hypothetical protein H2204_011719 [Knufia peltigerae]